MSDAEREKSTFSFANRPVRYTWSCDVAPGVRKQDLDEFLLGAAVDHWTNEPYCRSYEVYGNFLAGGPDRIVVMEVDSMASLQGALGLPVRGDLQPEFMKMTVNRRADLYHRMYPDYPDLSS